MKRVHNPQTVPNKPIKGAVEPTVARKEIFSTFLSSLSVTILKNKLADCTEEDCLLVFNGSAIAALNINVAGSVEFAGKLLLKFLLILLSKIFSQTPL